MKIQLGMNSRIYAKTTGSYVELVAATERTYTLSNRTIDTTPFSNTGWVVESPSLKTGTVSFKLLWANDDPGLELLLAAYTAGASVDFLILDKDRSSATAEGVEATTIFSDCTQSTNVEGVVEIQFNMRITEAVGV